MTADQLPETLLQLRDIHLPEAAGWWPPAPGWWLLTALTGFAVYWVLLKSLREIRFRLWRRRLLKAFDPAQDNLNEMTDSEFMSLISRRLKQLGITLFPAREVASLSGSDWLDFLDEHLPSGSFKQLPASLLVELPYRDTGTALTAEQRHSVLQLAITWAVSNINREHFHAV